MTSNTKSTSCIKKDVKSAVRYTQRKALWPGHVKINNAIYSHESLKEYLGTNVLVVNGREGVRVYDTKRKFICVAENPLALPRPERKKVEKTPKEKPYTMKIHKSLERIREGELRDMGLFELSINALMPCGVFRELKRRLELVRLLLKNNDADGALNIVTSLLENPQETRRRNEVHKQKSAGRV